MSLDFKGSGLREKGAGGLESFEFDYEYDLPEELIAQVPADARGASRLMVVDRRGGRGGGRVGHYSFRDIGDFLRAGDLVVVNDSRVMPAAVYGRKDTGGKVRLLFLGAGNNGGDDNRYRCLIYGKRVREGTRIALPGGVDAVVLGKGGEEACDGFDGGYLVSLPDRFGGDERALFDYLEEWGRTPLPPYIKRSHNGSNGGDAGVEGLDRERYQTVYAGPRGSVAAPTAGLHFDEDTIERLEGMGVEFKKITLHVGPGTFLPIKSLRLEDHIMHGEAYEIGEDAAEAVNRAKGEGRRVIAVGTTTVRALESAADEKGTVKSGRDVTSLFIVPGHRFRVVDVLLTNFHLPRSTLIVMVSAFCEAPGVSGWELILGAYGEAIEKRYRFYSYGDAMLIV